MNAIYVSYDGALDPLGRSHVVPYLEGLSARGARIALSFPGSPDDLARALSAQGLSLRGGPDGLILSGAR